MHAFTEGLLQSLYPRRDRLFVPFEIFGWHVCAVCERRAPLPPEDEPINIHNLMVCTQMLNVMMIVRCARLPDTVTVVSTRQPRPHLW